MRPMPSDAATASIRTWRHHATVELAATAPLSETCQHFRQQGSSERRSPAYQS